MRITKRQLRRIIREAIIKENIPQSIDPGLEYKMAEELANEMHLDWEDGVYNYPDMRKEEYINVGSNAIEDLTAQLMDKYKPGWFEREESTTSDDMERIRKMASDMFLEI